MSAFPGASTEAMFGKKLRVLTSDEYNLIKNKEPGGTYDTPTRESLYRIIQKLADNRKRCTNREKKIFKKFFGTHFDILLESGTESEGKILHPGGMRVRGHFDGEIILKETLIVEPDGWVRGTVSAGAIVCEGRIEGDVQALSTVKISDGGTLKGTVQTPSIHIEMGAIFEGKSTMPRQPQEFHIKEKVKPGKLLSTG